MSEGWVTSLWNTIGRTDAVGWIRRILSPVVAFLLLSTATQAGWVSVQTSYSSQPVTVTFLGPSLDLWLWICLTTALGLTATVDLLRKANRIDAAGLFSLVFSSLVVLFVMAAALTISTLAITVGALIYFLDLAAMISLGTPHWASFVVKILGFLGPLTCAFVLTIVGELAYPASVHSMGQQLPSLLFTATQLTIAAYHGLDPTVPAIYAVLLLLPFGLLLMGFLGFDRRFLPGLHGFPEELGLNTARALALLFGGFASVLLFIPYWAAGRPLGVDFSWYIDNLRTLCQGDAALASFSHPLIFLIPLAFERAFQVSPELAIQLVTMIAAVCAASSAGWFTLLVTKSRTTALMSVLFSLFSVRTTAGYFAGILANWLALAEMFAALGLLVLYLQGCGKWELLLAIGLNVLVFVTHVETWLMLSALMLLIGMRSRKAVVGIVVTMLVLLLAATRGSSVLPGLFVESSQVAGAFSIWNPAAFFANLVALSQSFTMGLFRDPVLLILSILGLVYASAMFLSRSGSSVILFWSALSGFFVLFFAPAFAWRALYQIPYEVLAAFGASQIWRACASRSTSQLYGTLGAAVLLAISLATVANGIRSILILVG